METVRTLGPPNFNNLFERNPRSGFMVFRCFWEQASLSCGEPDKRTVCETWLYMFININSKTKCFQRSVYVVGHYGSARSRLLKIWKFRVWTMCNTKWLLPDIFNSSLFRMFQHRLAQKLLAQGELWLFSYVVDRNIYCTTDVFWQCRLFERRIHQEM